MNFLQRIKDGAGRASERAQSAVEIGRLNSHISDIQREIDVHLLRMGQVFYANYRSPDTAPAEEEVMELCTACDLLTEEISELRVRIAELRSERLCECGARLDIDAKSCPHCGRKFVEDAEPAPASEVSDDTLVIPAVRLRKPSEEEQGVEPEAVHDLVGEPGFERDEEAPGRREDEDFRQADELLREEPADGYEEELEIPEREYVRERPVRPEPRQDRVDEDEQFETKRYDLGGADEDAAFRVEEDGIAGADTDDVLVFGGRTEEGAERARGPEEESAEEREERQRRELREIRMRERRKMKEAQERKQAPEREASDTRTETADAPEADAEAAPPEPAYDAEYERRQRERVEREQERQDELDRLIASWNGGITRGDDESEEKFVVRRPSGEVVRCQVCGSGLPKGSKWCPHCASEQI